MVSELFNTTAPIDLGQYFFWTSYKKINWAFEGINFTPTVPLSCVFDNQKKSMLSFQWERFSCSKEWMALIFVLVKNTCRCFINKL